MLSQKNIYGVIYRVTNTENGMIYIGKTRGRPIDRFNQTWRQDNSKYAKELRKYQEAGKIDVFKIETICFCLDSVSLLNSEKEIIKAHYEIFPNRLYNTHIAQTYSSSSRKYLIQKIIRLEKKLLDVKVENENLKNKISSAEHKAYLRLVDMSDKILLEIRHDFFKYYYEEIIGVKYG